MCSDPVNQPSCEDVQFLLAVIVMMASWMGFGIAVTLYRTPRQWMVWFYGLTFYLALAAAMILFAAR